MIGKSENSISNGIEKSVSQLGQVITASLRPLPTETGDGSYVAASTSTGIVKDLSHVDLKDVKTLMDVTKSAATGEAVNDRNYIMEREIQVSSILVLVSGCI
jgi:linoleate 8R-lipoxygenase/9,12-octadecadienoate 8-hydroperoxide 8R-isomerase